MSYYFLIKSFNYPISARDTGNDLVRQRANSNAQSLDNFFQRSKYFVMEFTLSTFFQNLFNMLSSPVIKCKKTPRKKCSFVAEVKGKR